eukprot:CAMPEP_0174371432 /NCGR_PEP_ID=MMETSP0811_2-20130205/99748_1 /TAXON_ID=73025 ORGANISM="Eutreptiella gymnastica-like, Strain CCMP1594" /NCGR_SAMPLE_ID=MMETSP0811_2 /ASSEMBLY_ACC=CAM_ASM_000667 /LENGTH=161 /DNA_ID=CAMNT_0015517799 /DNA_START=15 /DNA_END=497 /DNA_ORIENTATION=-
MYSRIYRPAAYAALAGVSFTWYLHNNADCDGAVQLIAKEGVPYRVVMSGDVGGTNSRLKMFKVDQNAEIKKRERAPGTLIFESKYANIEFKSLAEVVEKFIKDADAAAKTNGTDIQRPTSACFAVAGVVQANQCRLTNIDWVVDGDEMAKDLGIELGNLEI